MSGERDGPFCEGTPHSVGRCRAATEGPGRVSGPAARRVGERNVRVLEILNKDESLSLRPFGPPPSQREAFDVLRIERYNE